MRAIDVPIMVVLGAPNDDDGRLLAVATGRAEAAVREQRRNPSWPLILTGGFGDHFNRTARPHFEYVAAFLEAQGVPRSAVLASLPSSNTFDDARQVAELLAGQSAVTLRVVTSDFHASRARLLFQRAFAGRQLDLEMVVAPAGVAPEELSRLLRHEAEAVGRLAA
jgi:uncharacterized SAM-binding protein YcdF (DUF218 family)